MYKKRSLKFNYIARTSLGFVELAFSLFCFPYVASILSPESIGKIDYINVLSLYFVTLSTFGITEYGLRAIGKERGAGVSLENGTLTKLLHLRIWFVGILTLLYTVLVLPIFGDGSLLFNLSPLIIFISFFNISWALEGVEDFSFLAFSKFISKLGFLAYILLFIKSNDDLEIYFLGVMGFDLIYFLFSFARLKFKYAVSLSFKRMLTLPDFKMIPLLFQLFLLNLLQSSMAALPALIMGKLNLLEELGYFSVAQRFFWMGFYLIIPLSSVLLTRTVGVVDADEKDKHLSLSIIAALALCLPITFGMISVSDDIIHLFVGEKYQNSILLLKLLSVLISIFAVNNFWSMQVIYSSHKDKELVKYNLLGLVFMLISSIALISLYQEIGAVLSLLITHSLLFVVFYSAGRKIHRLKNVSKDITKSFIASVVMLFVVKSISMEYSFAVLAIKVSLGVFVYASLLFIMRHSFVLNLRRKKSNP